MKMLTETLLILCYVLCFRYFTPYHEWHVFASGIPFCAVTKKTTDRFSISNITVTSQHHRLSLTCPVIAKTLFESLLQ